MLSPPLGLIYPPLIGNSMIGCWIVEKMVMATYIHQDYFRILFKKNKHIAANFKSGTSTNLGRGNLILNIRKANEVARNYPCHRTSRGYMK